MRCAGPPYSPESTVRQNAFFADPCCHPPYGVRQTSGRRLPGPVVLERHPPERMTTARPLNPTAHGLPASCRSEDTPMPEPQPRPAAIQPTVSDCRPVTDEAREAALQRVCAGFVTTISPRSAARLADLLSSTTYVQAA